jgi:hypothetical protein
MLNKDQFLDSVNHEIHVIKHLATKVPAGAYDWRPTPGQRSIIELMRYLTTCAVVPALFHQKGNWDDAEAIETAAESVTPETFDAAMDMQATRIRNIVESMPHEKLHHGDSTMPWGTPCKTGEGLVNTVIKALVAYRMQFFLYIKQAGRPDIGPANCWVGRDSRPQPAAAPAAK